MPSLVEDGGPTLTPEVMTNTITIGTLTEGEPLKQVDDLSTKKDEITLSPKRNETIDTDALPVRGLVSPSPRRPTTPPLKLVCKLRDPLEMAWEKILSLVWLDRYVSA